LLSEDEHAVFWNKNPGKEQSKKKKKQRNRNISPHSRKPNDISVSPNPAPAADSLAGDDKHVLKGTLSSPLKKIKQNTLIQQSIL